MAGATLSRADFEKTMLQLGLSDVHVAADLFAALDADRSGLLEWINIAPEQLHGWLLRHARLCLSPGDEFVPV